MNETEKGLSAENVEEYLETIHWVPLKDNIIYFLTEAKKISKKLPRDIFITNSVKEGQNRGVDSEPEDLWFFLDDYCIKVRGIETKKNTEKLELIPLKGKVQNVCIVEQNCRPPEGAGPTPAPQITVTIKREGIEEIERKRPNPLTATRC